MYFLWWPNHIVPTHVIKVAKNLRVVCENIVRVHKCLILWWFEIQKKSNTLTHNPNCLMGTITFEIHRITPTSPKNMLVIIFKSILFFLLLFFLECFSFWAYHAWTYKREKRNTHLCKLKHHNFAMLKHIDIIYDWRDLVVRWLFMHFS